jgi:hypothetical protein
MYGTVRFGTDSPLCTESCPATANCQTTTNCADSLADYGNDNDVGVRYCADLTKIRGMSRCEVVVVVELGFFNGLQEAIYTFRNHMTELTANGFANDIVNTGTSLASTS